MKNKLLKMLSLFAVASMLLVACGGQVPTEKPAAQMPAQLNVWITWGDNPQQLQALFDKFGQANNVKVVVTAPVEDDKILPALSGSEPPDILILGDSLKVKSYFKENLTVDLTNAIKTGGVDLNDIYESTLKQCRVGDKIICLPWGTDVYALYWNKDMFEAAGLDPNTPPKTLEELADFADKLTKVGSDGTIEQIGFIPDQAWGHTEVYSRMFGGFWYNDDGTKLTANSQPMLDALTWQQQFYKKYGYDNVTKFSTGFGDQYMSPDYPFYTGKLAMVVDGEWQTGPNFIAKFKPELNYGVAPLPPPAAHPELANTAVVEGTVVVMPANGKNQDAAAKLLAWMMSPAIVAEEMCYNANLPTSKKAAEDKCFTDNAKMKIFLDLMAGKNSVPYVNSPIATEFNDAQATAEENILHTGADPKTEMDKLQSEFAPKLEDALK
jgi:multiple sugar transport system substrate-binding protein